MTSFIRCPSCASTPILGPICLEQNKSLPDVQVHLRVPKMGLPQSLDELFIKKKWMIWGYPPVQETSMSHLHPKSLERKLTWTLHHPADFPKQHPWWNRTNLKDFSKYLALQGILGNRNWKAWVFTLETRLALLLLCQWRTGVRGSPKIWFYPHSPSSAMLQMNPNFRHQFLPIISSTDLPSSFPWNHDFNDFAEWPKSTFTAYSLVCFQSKASTFCSMTPWRSWLAWLSADFLK